ncbi:MAG TPA: histidine kinase [Gemmatimonadaceae bacterium]|jgi:signal transduction histidine kinase|nr:histidine kinase [Gemmatimonadaceae bacterium]
MLVSAAWIVPAAFGALDRFAQGRLSGGPSVSIRDLIWASGDWFLYAFLTPAVFALSRRFPIVRPHVARRVLIHFALSLLFCVAWATAGKLLQFSLTLAFQPHVAHAALLRPNVWTLTLRDWLGWVFTTLPFGVAVYLCVVGVEHAIRYFVATSERDVQLARLSEQLSSARLSALQAQLNPHFLFNSLNTVAVLVRDGDAAAATHVIEQLSDVLRRTLGRGRASEVELADELELARQYLAVEKARFSDRLRPEFHVDPSTLSAAVPSFVLQHLVENAVRHGIARRMDAGRVSVDARREGDMVELSVTDDGAGIPADASWAAGHGLSNTRERLATLYGDAAALTVSDAAPYGTVARVRLPYRELMLDAGPTRAAP